MSRSPASDRHFDGLCVVPMQQQRFLLFLVISVAILFGWNYFFPLNKNPQPNANNANTAQQVSSPTGSPAGVSPTVSPAGPATAQPPIGQNQPGAQAGPAATAAENVEHRQVTIESPLYKVTLDNQGAVVTSWVIKENKSNNKELWSVASDKKNKVPLELVLDPAKLGLGAEHRVLPLLLKTGDPVIDSILANKNYVVSGLDENGQLKLEDSESRTVQFSLHDDATGIDVVKKLTFRGDLYNVEVSTTVTRNGQPLPQAKIAIGPSIGDQGVPHYTFYSYAPEGVVSVNNSVERVNGKSVDEAKSNAGHHVVDGNVDWAGVGDTYFAMVAVPSKPLSGLEYTTAKYEWPMPSGKKETRYLITGYVPVGTDGSPTAIYVGPKDHNLLKSASAQIESEVHRQVDLEGLFNYGWFATVKRALAFPILGIINWLQKLTGSYGVAIILFTILLYSLFFPLKWRSSKSMKKAQKLAPRMKELQEKIKGLKQNDPRLKELQKEQLLLMKEGNPLGGCLPLLIQMPFLFALYSAITISIDFRQAPFLWMSDLSSGDPYHILEVLMAGSMVVLQLVTPAPSADPVQRKMMAFTMPALMLWILWGAPSGLLVYWLVGNIVGFLQQFIINYMTKSEDDAEPPAPVSSRTTKKKLSPPRVSEA
jgi:YidC/Oxa1 family membrane protein insertase